SPGRCTRDPAREVPHGRRFVIALTLAELAGAVGGDLVGGDLVGGDATITGSVLVDSRAVRAGDLFAALPGERVDGADYLPAAAGPTVRPQGSFNTDIGLPLTVLTAGPDTRFLVLEMGARGPGHIARLCRIARPDIGVVLNVGSAHLGEFGSAEVIAASKGE